VRARVFLFGMILLSAVAARAQMPAPVVSPEISADRTITLRYRAPDAKQITVTGELDGQPHSMTKGSDGVWTVTIGPLAPDIYNKQFKLFWIGVGKDDMLTGPGDHAFEEMLTKRGITHTSRFTEGRHEWTVWRHHLNEVAPLLFK
jgi:hypothetical protein